MRMILLLLVFSLSSISCSRDKGKTDPLAPQNSLRDFQEPAGGTTSVPSLKEEGEWESSGGDGVLCEKELFLLENFESFKSGQLKPWSEIQNESDYKNILQKTLARIRLYSPVFAEKMDLSLQYIRLDQWQNKSTIKEIEDSIPKIEIPKNCSLVQIAQRESISNPGYLPQVKVYFKQSYFERLSPIDQAMLVLHESVYLIAKEIGHKNSDHIRNLNAFFFSSELESFLSEPYHFSQKAKKFQTILSPIFGDYFRFFYQEDFYQQSGGYNKIKHRNNYTRSKSLYQINSDLRKQLGNCQKNSPENHKALCQDKVMLSPDLYETINTREKAFIFLMNYFFDHHGMILLSTENLVVLDHSDPEKQDEDIQIFLGAACGHIEGFTEKNLERPLPRFQSGLLVLNQSLNAEIYSHFDGKNLWLRDFLFPSLGYCKAIRQALSK